jgi:hypothetical protein
MELAIKVRVVSPSGLVEVLLQNEAQRGKIFDAVVHQSRNCGLQAWRCEGMGEAEQLLAIPTGLLHSLYPQLL